MANNVIKFVPTQRKQQETTEPKRKVKLLGTIWKAILDGIGEPLLFSGWINVFLCI